MRTAARRKLWDIDSFIAWEMEQTDKHELVHGEILAMVGGIIGHALITLNIASALRKGLKRPRMALASDAMVRVDARGSVYFPDVVVTCREQSFRSTAVVDPVLVVEVLSESTRGYDRTIKRLDYQAIPSLSYVLLVDTDERRVELDRRDPDGGWTRETVTGEGAIDLPELGVSLDLDEIYENAEPVPGD